jgi:hypothetical protein
MAVGQELALRNVPLDVNVGRLRAELVWIEVAPYRDDEVNREIA